MERSLANLSAKDPHNPREVRPGDSSNIDLRSNCTYIYFMSNMCTYSYKYVHMISVKTGKIIYEYVCLAERCSEQLLFAEGSNGMYYG